MNELSFEIADLNSVEESLRDLYKQNTASDGATVYRLNVKDVKPLEEFKKVYNTLEKERELHNTFEAKLKEFGEYTPEKITELVDKLNSYETSGNNKNEEFVKKVAQIREDSTKAINAQKETYEKKIAELTKTINEKEFVISDMNKTSALKQAFAEKGDPSMFDAFCGFVKNKIEWDESQKTYVSEDRLYTLAQYVDDVFAKMPGFMKPNLSANAREGNGGGSDWEQYFNPNSKTYNKDKQVELFRKDRERALSYKNKYEPDCF